MKDPDPLTGVMDEAVRIILSASHAKRERSVRADDSVNHMLSFAVNRMFYENTGDYSLSLQGQ